MHDPATEQELVEWLDGVLRWARVSLPTHAPDTISYGDSPEQVIDLWRPRGASRDRLVVSIHGGGFTAEDTREVHEPLVRGLVARGFIVANVEYRRIGSGGGILETTSDVDIALEALADAEGIPDGGFAVVGQSAGGYLALWTATRAEVDLVLALSPLTDLLAWAKSGDGTELLEAWAGALPADAPDLYQSADLVTRMPTGTRTVIMHGDHDAMIPCAQSVRFAGLARDAGETLSLDLLEDEGHFGWLDPRLPASRAAQKVLMERWSG